MLKTKSIQNRTLKSDGLRICVMRRPGEFENWDMWMPKLSPSHELLNAYKYENLSWEEMTKRFSKEVLKKQKHLIWWLAKLALKQEVTLLCWEETANRCHRKLLVEACQRLEPKLLVNVK